MLQYVIFSFDESFSFGTACFGILPGSVNPVFAWEANANAQIVQYVTLTNEGRELFFANSVTVKPAYTIAILNFWTD
jgi:hypothetical protein